MRTGTTRGDDVERVEVIPDSRPKLRCAQCGHTWLRGTVDIKPPSLPSLAEIKARFPKPGDVDPTRLARAHELKKAFLAEMPVPDPAVARYWRRYDHIFSAEGLPTADPKNLKNFANSNVGANPGNMSVFNDAWNEMGAEAGTTRVRALIDYLLRGPSAIALEDRLTKLIEDTKSFGMKGLQGGALDQGAVRRLSRPLFDDPQIHRRGRQTRDCPIDLGT